MTTLDISMASDERGMDFSIGDHYENHRSSWVNTRLYLVFLISPLLLIGFWTNLVLTESHSPGHGLWEVWSRTCWEHWIILELHHPDIFMDIGTFLTWNPQSNCLILNVGSPPSVPRRFQRYLGWFWGRKASLIRGELRGSCFVSWFKLVGLDIVWQQLWTWT